MNKRFAAIFGVIIIIVFIGYMIFDTSHPGGFAKNEMPAKKTDTLPERWQVSGELKIDEGSLKAVTASQSGEIYLAGDSFVSCYGPDLKLLWSLNTPYPVTSLSNYGGKIFASTMELILVISSEGELIEEWGPFEDNAIITSVTSNKSYVAFSDAGNKVIFVLDKNGIVIKLIGQNDGQFVVPSPYFDVALDSVNTLFVANTGHRRVEKRTIDGALISYFGEPGTAPGAFCGCCNPAHFTIIPEGFITAEKGINRIKILSQTGDFIEYVSIKNKFTVSVPLDLASPDGKTIYAANPSDSKLYIFTRK